MLERWKKALKSQKGFTLVELLAVIVILGIIAAIAVPAIGNVIDNSKSDAHEANASSLREAARLYEVTEDVDDETITLADLIDEGYIDGDVENPDGGVYSQTDSTVNLSNGTVTLDGETYEQASSE
ncbi:competence type IV pilus major pilin ComGC [Halobacillus campisalis]|uniref:Competence type IV pilus major pilin ComGC n=1 Tax=Halobacillus campisalis TaxID=435909 RepID=A0ABW2K4P7_9BACI|nr:prepilin-type N-terminal cleavage/methylation domain-containing protein [Halobacillus campisalis]